MAQKALPRRKARKINRLVVMNPSKGLNNVSSALLVDNREMSEMLNMEFDESGVIRKRSGYSAVGGALTGAKGLGVFKNETYNYPVTVDGTSLKYYNSGWNTVSGISFTAGNEANFSQSKNKLFIWNGVDGGAVWNGVALTRPGSMPKAKFAVTYQGKHIASGVTGQPNRLYIAKLSDPTQFTVATGGTQPQPDNTNDVDNGNPNVPGATVFSADATGLTNANVIDVRKDDGDFITGLGFFLDTVIIFKSKAIYQLTFNGDTPVVVPITQATGCLSHKSIVQVENDLFFLSREGIRSLGNEPNFFTAVRTAIISIRVNPLIQSINSAYFNRCNGIYINNEYILAVPTGTSAVDTCIVYDKRFGAFTKWDTLAPSGMIQYVDSNSKAHFYFLDSGGLQMYEVIAGQYNDNGAAINGYITTKSQDFGNVDLMKRFVDNTLFFRSLSGQITCTVYTDDNASAGSVVIGTSSADGMGLFTLGSTALGVGTGASSAGINADKPVRIVMNQNSRTSKTKISNNRVNENFVFLGYSYGYYLYSHFLFDSSNKVYI